MRVPAGQPSFGHADGAWQRLPPPVAARHSSPSVAQSPARRRRSPRRSAGCPGSSRAWCRRSAPAAARRVVAVGHARSRNNRRSLAPPGHALIDAAVERVELRTAAGVLAEVQAVAVAHAVLVDAVRTRDPAERRSRRCRRARGDRTSARTQRPLIARGPSAMPLESQYLSTAPSQVPLAVKLPQLGCSVACGSSRRARCSRRTSSRSSRSSIDRRLGRSDRRPPSCRRSGRSLGEARCYGAPTTTPPSSPASAVPAPPPPRAAAGPHATGGRRAAPCPWSPPVDASVIGARVRAARRLCPFREDSCYSSTVQAVPAPAASSATRKASSVHSFTCAPRPGEWGR